MGEIIGPDPRNFNQRVSLGRNDLLIRTFPSIDDLRCCVDKGSIDLKSSDRQLMHSNEKIWSRDKISNMSFIELLSPLIKELHEGSKGIVKNAATFTFENDRRLVLYCYINGPDYHRDSASFNRRCGIGAVRQPILTSSIIIDSRLNR